MPRQHRESGAALIMLIGMTAALAILTAALVMLLANQQGATAASRQSKTSLDYGEAALNSGINAIKITTQSGSNFPTVSPGVDMSSMNVQYAAACPSPAPTATYNVYDNSTPVDKVTHWDANLDHKLWVEAVVTFKGRTSRLRQMLDSSTMSAVLPMAAMYADTKIVLNGTSNAYAVQPDNTFVPATSQYAYNIMAGGSYTNNSNQVVTGNNGTTLRPPTGTTQSLGFKVNGTVSLPGVTENGVVQGGVGLLSDYFDQARQYALTVEAQSGMGTSGLAMHNDTAAPTAPAQPTTLSLTTAQFTQANLASYYNSTTKVYTIPSVNVTGGNLTLSAASFPSGASFNFSGTLYVATGGLSVTGNLPITVSTLRATGLTISGATTTITDDLGTAYVTGATAVSGRVALTTNSTATSYFGGAFSHTPSTAVTDNLGPLYFAGNATFSSASGNLSIAGGKNVHAGGTFTITGPTSSSSTVPCVFGSLYSVGSISITGNAVVDTTDLYTGGSFTVSGNTANLTGSNADQFGPVYVTGIADWRCGSTSARLGIQTTSATTTAYSDPTTPGPMYAQIFLIDGNTTGDYVSGTGPYDVVLGDVWVDGNAGTGDVAVNFSAPSSGTPSTIMCPLLATTEKTCTNGYMNIGTLTDPMVYYMQCDNDGLYSNTCEWASTGTFTGIAIIMEADIQVTGGNNGASWQTANFVGSLMAGCPVTPDITMSSNSSVCYHQKVVENLPANLQSILRTTTTTTVPGTWQQLPAN
jgi:hypothetical protein